MHLVRLVHNTSRRNCIGIVTTASLQEHQALRTYHQAFTQLGIEEVQPLTIQSRQEANSPRWLNQLTAFGALFFVGGKQLRITSLLGGTLFNQALNQACHQGLIVAGTSAGAAMMSATMIVEGDPEDIPTRQGVRLAPGLGLWPNAVIDQHFTQRGRLGRLLAALAQNPAVLGVGIDQDTAIYVDRDQDWLEVWGSQTVSLVDGWSITETNAAESGPKEPLALFNVSLHVLSRGYGFHLGTRKPIRIKEETVRDD
ncbi:MAG: cyanophycinase [Firmicutes bacterium]|nr:cyanophycinase [Bacillota bacterium]